MGRVSRDDRMGSSLILLVERGGGDQDKVGAASRNDQNGFDTSFMIN